MLLRPHASSLKGGPHQPHRLEVHWAKQGKGVAVCALPEGLSVVGGDYNNRDPPDGSAKPPGSQASTADLRVEKSAPSPSAGFTPERSSKGRTSVRRLAKPRRIPRARRSHQHGRTGAVEDVDRAGIHDEPSDAGTRGSHLQHALLEIRRIEKHQRRLEAVEHNAWPRPRLLVFVRELPEASPMINESGLPPSLKAVVACRPPESPKGSCD
jgi:hypothetical protein